MANRMPVVGGSWASTPGAWYGSEVQIGVAATINAVVAILSSGSQTLLAPNMPGVFMLTSTLVPTVSTGVVLQYSPDNATTWRNYGVIGSAAVMAALDGSSNWRLLGGGTAANVFFVPVKVLT